MQAPNQNSNKASSLKVSGTGCEIIAKSQNMS